jgi:methionyl-tRNA formyltransferase
VRLAYLGTPEIAVPPLRALHGAGHEIRLVVSGPDRRRGRGSGLSPSPVKRAAMDLGLPVTDHLDDVTSVGADLGVVVAYGRIIPVSVLEKLPMVNLHFSLLPRWRGAAPVQRAILEGDDRTGVCLMAVDQGLDTGGVYARAEVPIERSSTAESLRDELVAVGTDLLVGALDGGLGEPVPQSEEGVTYAEKLHSDDLRLDWSRSAEELHRLVRVGGAWTTFAGRRLKVLSADVDDEVAGSDLAGVVIDGPQVRCGAGTLVLKLVQPEGRPVMPAADWANGARPAGERLGT